ncbi:ribose ABC transport system [Desulfocucumis palustris]|uniref:Ribose ABC transport system n=1 Tax=Desulfocucumis palustris TaxID=1898651 RepID=A0A2L2XJ36_9FIRM|nr:sugar ABC transporter ATP-binding protein [Desulfocucumis palustris]GBF34276.1 ribose ABC transport system [Desulfocucumis palustris]
MPENYCVEMRGISKAFGGVNALKNVDLAVKKGEIHALVGENGAGKSTLMKILAGAIARDNGQILLDGGEISITDPKSARNLGIGIIYQEFVLAKDLTVAENIFLNRLSEGLIINWKKLYRKAKDLLDNLGFDINPSATIDTLSVAHQQIVEICKALSENSRILIFDEPTAVLATREVERLFTLLETLKKQDVSIIYISHRLEEIFRIADNITVLKDGSTVGTVRTKDSGKDEIIRMMIGRNLESMFPDRNAEIGEEVLRVEGLNSGQRVKDVSFVVKAGEVVGISGLVGAGRTETVRAVFGADRKDGGNVYVMGKPSNIKSPRDAVRHGVGLLPEDRKAQGVLLHLPIKINSTMSAIKKISKGMGWISSQEENKLVEDLVKKLAIKTSGIDADVSSLSGGNQQKVAFSKWLASNCRILILDEPTRGVDVGAKVEIYKLINEIAGQGVGILMISSDMPEIIGMCDRVMVMKDGLVSGELAKSDLSEESILRLAIGG